MNRNTFEQQLVTWRHHFHQYPETAFNETQTAAFIANQLEQMGIEVATHIGKTGVVGTLKAGSGGHCIGLRSDMDANPIEEQGESDWKSRHPGCMHACGHDGHMTQLLGAAWLLSQANDFNGTVRFVFQPAEEPGKGAQAMLDDGLLERFPMDEIYGLHNMPAIQAGKVHVRAGGIMASEDNFAIQIHGKGAHASSPHMGIDPLVTAAEIIMQLQTIASRSADPLQPVVVSCTELFTDGAHNAIPSHVTLLGDTRSYSPVMQQLIEDRMRVICEKTCELNGAGCDFSYTHEFAPTLNTAEQADIVAQAARRIVGAENVDASCEPSTISEDFAHFLEHIPGAYFFLGSGHSAVPSENTMLHNPSYNYNDSILTTGAAILAEIVKIRLQ